MKKLTITSQLLVWLLAVGFLASCSEDEEVSQQAPNPPPASVFAVEFPTINVENGRYQEENYHNAVHALLSYGGWQKALEAYLIYPVFTFASVIQQTPQYSNEEGRWLWQLNTEVLGNKVQVDLYGLQVGNNSVWEMYVSQEGGFQNLLWLSGTSALDGSGGNWTLRGEIEDPRDVLSIEWRQEGGEIPYAKYTGLDSESDIYEDFIEYGTLTEGDFNVFYNISDEDNLLEIEYNNKTRIGRITDPVKFGDQAWYCWNSDYQNVECQ